MTRTRLLVDYPDPSASAMIASMLWTLNCEVIETSRDGTIREWLCRQPGLVLLGPDASGSEALELLGVLRREHPEVPVILLSPSPPPGLATRAQRMGASAVLKFPIPANQLRAAVVQALASDAGDAPAEVGRRGGSVDDAPATSAPGGHDREADADETPDCSCHTHADDAVSIRTLREAMEGPEREVILRTLEFFGWEISRTAKALDINRTTLYKKIKKYAIPIGGDARPARGTLSASGSSRAQRQRG